jgi:hypothetical protein
MVPNHQPAFFYRSPLEELSARGIHLWCSAMLGCAAEPKGLASANMMYGGYIENHRNYHLWCCCKATNISGAFSLLVIYPANIPYTSFICLIDIDMYISINIYKTYPVKNELHKLHTAHLL